MEAFKGIKVEITSGGKTLPLYNDPDTTEDEEDNTKQYYVEALTGQTFVASVTISDKFKAKASDGVRVQMIADGNTSAWGAFIPRSLWTGSRSGCKYKFDGITQYCEKSRQWRTYEYSFGKLNIRKNIKSENRRADHSILQRSKSALRSLQLAFGISGEFGSRCTSPVELGAEFRSTRQKVVQSRM